MVADDDASRKPVVLDAVEQVRGGDDPDLDRWAQRVDLLGDSTGWAGSTFVAVSDELPTGALELDVSHKTDPAPYIVLSVAPAVTRDLALNFFTWELAEKPRLARTFVKQTVQLVDR